MMPHPGGYTEGEQMNTAEVAEHLGTTPRELRQFLRSDHSTFVPVGSGARYDFTTRELPTLATRFTEWKTAGRPRPAGTKVTVTIPLPDDDHARRLAEQRASDRVVWEEEGPIVIPDIRDPRVRARALRDARAAEDRLEMKLLALGLHITQKGN
jgi:hypothetical protein